MANETYLIMRVTGGVEKSFDPLAPADLKDAVRDPGAKIEVSAETMDDQQYREARREHFLSQVELGRLGDALRQAEKDRSCSPWVIAAIRLLTFTGARRNEIQTLRWEHVSEEHECVMLPDSKTGRKAIHLNAPALALLQTIFFLQDLV